MFEPREDLRFVLDAIKIATSELKDTPLIGFAGAPFTVASYMIEGGYSRHFLKTKNFMYQHPRAWHRLMEKLATVTSGYLQAQVEAGASTVQLFDSWVGALGPADYASNVLAYSKRILDSVHVPSIHFSTGTAGFLDLISKAGGDIIGVDWRISLSYAWRSFPEKAIQGNLDPACLLKPEEDLARDVREVMKQAEGKTGHIFNLGHGVYPEVPMNNVARLIEEVHGHKS